MDKPDFGFIKGLRFRTYIYGIMAAVIALLSSYNIIDNSKVSLWNVLALAVSGMGYVGGNHTLAKTREIHDKLKEEEDDNFDG